MTACKLLLRLCGQYDSKSDQKRQEENYLVRGIARNLLRGWDKIEGLGTEVPQRGPGADPRWGSGAKLMLISSYDGGMHPCLPVGNATVFGYNSDCVQIE